MVFVNFNDLEKQVYRPILLEYYVKKSVKIGIIAAIIVVFSVLSIGTLSQIDDSKENASGSTTEDIGTEIRQESKPPGKDLSIELEEKMGFTAP